MVLIGQDINQEINAILKFKCTFHSFNFIEHEQGWTNNDALDPLLFYHDKLHLYQKRNLRLSESIITAKEDTNIDQNTHFIKMTNKKYNQFMKTYKMAVCFKLNHTDFPPLFISTVCKPVFSVCSSLSCTTASRFFFPKKLVPWYSSPLLKLVINLSLGLLAFFPGKFASKHLQNPSQFPVFALAHNIPTKLKH